MNSFTHTRSATTTLAIALAIGVTLTACPGRRDGLSRDALERSLAAETGRETLPTVDELLSLRVPSLPPMPAALTGDPTTQAFARHDDDTLRERSTDASLRPDQRLQAVWLRCLLATGRRDGPVLLETCSAVARQAPADLRAVGALTMLHRAIPTFNDDELAQLRATSRAVVETCPAGRGAASCALLVMTTDRLFRAATFEDGRPELVAALERNHPWLVEADVDGPWLRADEHFTPPKGKDPHSRALAALAASPLKPHPHHRVEVQRRASGTITPAVGQAGFYRVRFRAKSDAVDGTVFVDARAPFELRVDGVSLAVFRQGEISADITRVPVSLKAGHHEIELMAYDGGDGIRVTVLDDDGRPALTPIPTGAWGKPAGVSLRKGDDGLAGYLLPPRFDTADTDGLAMLMTAFAVRSAGIGTSSDDVRALVPALIRHYGWSAPVLVAAADQVDGGPLPDTFEDALAAPLWTAAEALWPASPLPLLARARRTAKDQPEAALALFRQLAKEHPTYAIAWRELVPRLMAFDVVDEAVVAADTALGLGLSSRTVNVVIPALLDAGRLQQVAALRDLFAGRSRDRTHFTRPLQRGDLEAVRRELNDLVGDDGHGSDDDDIVEADDAAIMDGAADHTNRLQRTARAIALGMAEVEAPERALSTLETMGKARAFRTGVALQRARLLVSLNQPEEALAILDALETASVPAELLREAAGGQALWEPRYALGDERLATWRARKDPYPGYGSAVILDDIEQVFAKDGSAIEVTHWMLELRSKAAIDSVGEVRADNGEMLLRLRVIKPDGRILEPEHHANIDDISLTGLAPGDIVEWLSVEANNAGAMGSLWRLRMLQNAVPAAERRLIVNIPASLEEKRAVAFIQEGGAPTPTTQQVGERTITTWSLQEAPAILPEPLAVSNWEAMPVVGLSIDLDESTFRQRARGLGLWRARADPWLKESAQRIAGNGDDDEKLRRLFRFVSESVLSAGDPDDAISTLATGRGDRLVLLAALARSVNLQAGFVAWHSPLSTPLEIPTSESFAGTVLAVDVGDVRHYIGTVGEGLVMDRLPGVVGAITMDGDTGVRGTLPPEVVDNSPMGVQLDLQYQRGDEGQPQLSGLAVLKLPAPAAEGIRTALRRATSENLQQYVMVGLASSLPGIRVTKVTIPGLESNGGPLALVADVVVDVSGTAGDGDLDGTGAMTVRFEHLFSQGGAAAFQAGLPLTEFLRVADRHRPMRLAASHEVLEVTIRLPSSASFIEVPPSTTLEAGPLRLVQQVEVRDGVLHWQRSLDVETARVSVAEWPALRGALAPLVSAADARLAFVVQAP